MSIWRDHEVTVGVRVAVQQHKVVLAAVEDEVFLVGILGAPRAENANVLGRCICDVLVAPRAPEVVHQRPLRIRW
jgi:hypothetical protein